jgi:ParB/RepB/Spo0J family partition protein
MTTAAPPADDVTTDRALVRDIPLGLLVPSPTQPRKHFDPEQLQELATDLLTHGVLSPLCVRPAPGIAGQGGYEIVFGERRYRAAQIAQLRTVPCLVRALTDLEVLEAQIAENIQRADMTPLEEADAYQQLQGLDPKYREAKVLAAQVGKSVRTIRERLRLLALTPAVREAVDDGSITIGHALLIAQLEPKAQALALKECFFPLYGERKGERELKSLKAFEEWFTNEVILDPEADVIADTFPELAGAVAQVQAAGGDILRLTAAWQAPKPRKGEPTILANQHFREATAKDPCAVTGVYVLGRQRGSIVKVCVDQTCTKHWPKPAARERSTSRGAAGGATETPEQKQRRLAKDAKERRKRELEQARRETVETRAMDAFLDRVGTAGSYDAVLRCTVVELLRGDVDLEALHPPVWREGHLPGQARRSAEAHGGHARQGAGLLCRESGVPQRLRELGPSLRVRGVQRRRDAHRQGGRGGAGSAGSGRGVR